MTAARPLRLARGLIADADPAATDGELLRRYAEGRDEAAFAELVRRNGRTGRVRLWKAATGGVVWSSPFKHLNDVTFSLVGFTPGAAELVLRQSESKRVHVIDVAKGEEVRSFATITEQVHRPRRRRLRHPGEGDGRSDRAGRAGGGSGVRAAGGSAVAGGAAAGGAGARRGRRPGDVGGPAPRGACGGGAGVGGHAGRGGGADRAGEGRPVRRPDARRHRRAPAAREVEVGRRLRPVISGETENHPTGRHKFPHFRP